VPPKVFELLDALIHERPRAGSKTDLHKRLWPDTFVSDANLTNLVAELRDALGDDAKSPRVIRTVQRFGYAFEAEATSEPEPAPGADSDSIYRLVWGSREVTLREGSNVIGRDRDAVLWIDVYSVSRQHARITVAGEDATLEDLGSKNGTFLDGRPVQGATAVKDGDVIRIGTVTMTLRRFDPVSTRTAGSR
jgi:FHA domain